MNAILFICNENSGRSQMAEAFFNHYNTNPEFKGLSAGLKAAESVKPLAIAVMKEKGIDMSIQKPKNLTPEMIDSAHRIFTMGCIKSCPVAPAEKTMEWSLEDPAGKPIETFRRVRDDISWRIKNLISELERPIKRYSVLD